MRATTIPAASIGAPRAAGGVGSFDLDARTLLVIDDAPARVLTCALGLVAVRPVAELLGLAEWTDILAKLRGLRAMGVEARGFPVVRQRCGCRVFVELGGAPDGDTLTVHLCAGHLESSTSKVVIGRLVAKEAR